MTVLDGMPVLIMLAQGVFEDEELVQEIASALDPEWAKRKKVMGSKGKARFNFSSRIKEASLRERSDKRGSHKRLSGWSAHSSNVALFALYSTQLPFAEYMKT